MIREAKTQLENRAISQKKISHYNKGLDTIIDLIAYVNDMPELEIEIWSGRTVDNVLIPRELSDFVYPSSIRYDSGDRRTKDLRVRNEKIGTPPCSYEEFVNACDQFRGNFKKDASSDMVSISTSRKAVNLADVISRISVNGNVNYYAGNFVPIPVEDISVLFDGERYFNDSAESVLKDYIADLRFNN